MLRVQFAGSPPPFRTISHTSSSVRYGTCATASPFNSNRPLSVGGGGLALVMIRTASAAATTRATCPIAKTSALSGSAGISSRIRPRAPLCLKLLAIPCRTERRAGEARSRRSAKRHETDCDSANSNASVVLPTPLLPCNQSLPVDTKIVPNCSTTSALWAVREGSGI
jgi:hypothetical protein